MLLVRSLPCQTEMGRKLKDLRLNVMLGKQGKGDTVTRQDIWSIALKVDFLYSFRCRHPQVSLRSVGEGYRPGFGGKEAKTQPVVTKKRDSCAVPCLTNFVGIIYPPLIVTIHTPALFPSRLIKGFHTAPPQLLSRHEYHFEVINTCVRLGGSGAEMQCGRLIPLDLRQCYSLTRSFSAKSLEKDEVVFPIWCVEP
ncbi:hypothetical protein PM082_016560 [Marasmius tenuissimus]|nr:hypothetical protein PM082_016560 [Marasmius tenuissimus]